MMGEITHVANLISVLENIEDKECEIFIKIPSVADTEFSIKKIIREYDLAMNAIKKDKILIIAD